MLDPATGDLRTDAECVLPFAEEVEDGTAYVPRDATAEELAAWNASDKTGWPPWAPEKRARANTSGTEA